MWRVTLSGHVFDLETLKEQFPDGDPCVVHDGDRFFLESAELDALAPNHVEVLERANSLLAPMNGAAQLGDPKHRPVSASGQIVGPDGREHVVVLVDSIEVRSKLGTVVVRVGDEEPPPPPPPAGQVALAAAAGNSDAQDALRLLGTGPLDWVNLYRILDYVRNTFGGLDGIEKAGLATKADLNRFTHTANSKAASGDDARHGPSPQAPPKNPMTLEEARTLIRSILKAWLAP
jgi:hypothetical protein